ncbi:MAG: pseudouridylate synthase [Herbinix sp.]|nr:pseudouridylate synthase [Herbinix sp.]
MKRVKLEVSYDGTKYCGWQIQTELQTIEGILNIALSQLLKEDITVIGASRTDSGVHAYGNVAVFDTESAIPPEKICFALNQRLPDDIKVQSSKEVPLDFHPRKVSCRKTYEYKIYNNKIPSPIHRLYSYFFYYNLDLKAMQEAAQYFIGTHDFKSFCSVKTQALETVRTIYSLDVSRNEDFITITITGNGFLYNMVRIIAGTLIEIGRGAYPPERIKSILEGCDRSFAGPTAPAHGLTLKKIMYDNSDYE